MFMLPYSTGPPPTPVLNPDSAGPSTPKKKLDPWPLGPFQPAPKPVEKKPTPPKRRRRKKKRKGSKKASKRYDSDDSDCEVRKLSTGIENTSISANTLKVNDTGTDTDTDSQLDAKLAFSSEEEDPIEVYRRVPPYFRDQWMISKSAPFKNIPYEPESSESEEESKEEREERERKRALKTSRDVKLYLSGEKECPDCYDDLGDDAAEWAAWMLDKTKGKRKHKFQFPIPDHVMLDVNNLGISYPHSRRKPFDF